MGVSIENWNKHLSMVHRADKVNMTKVIESSIPDLLIRLRGEAQHEARPGHAFSRPHAAHAIRLDKQPHPLKPTARSLQEQLQEHQARR
jgi:hypothetical protein